MEDALAALGRALDAYGAPWMIIGGIAAIGRGVRRLTTDIDAVVKGDAVDIAGLVAFLAKRGIRSRIEKPVAFAEQNLVLLMRHEASGVDFDISLGWSGFENEALEARAEARFGRVRVPMAAPADLIVFKTIAGRPKDLEDAESLLVLHPDLDVQRARRHVRQLAALAGEDELAQQFERIVARVRRARRKR